MICGGVPSSINFVRAEEALNGVGKTKDLESASGRMRWLAFYSLTARIALPFQEKSKFEQIKSKAGVRAKE